MSIHNDIGNQIRRIRRSKNMTQSDVSKVSCIGRPSVTMIELGKFNPTIDTLRQVALAIDCDLRVEFVEHDAAQTEKDGEK